MPKYSERSNHNLDTAHPLLQTLFNEVIKHRDCSVLCGHRGETEQNKAYNKGNSKVRWPKGRHNSMPSLAVDVAPFPINWEDKQRFLEFSEFVKGVAAGLKIPIKWGGDFYGFFDGPHWELIIDEKGE